MAPRILDRIDEPGGLRTLTLEELEQVAQEARDTIISVITERGGHLASNLGVVELTLALHRIFDSQGTASSGTRPTRPTRTSW